MRRFESTDIEELNAWHSKHGVPFVLCSSLPEIGFIEPGVACGFLYQTDSDIALLDGFATNPEASSQARSASLDSICEALLSEAERLGFRCAVGLCKDEGIARRSERHGMHSIGVYEMTAKEF